MKGGCFFHRDRQATKKYPGPGEDAAHLEKHIVVLPWSGRGAYALPRTIAEGKWNLLPFCIPGGFSGACPVLDTGFAALPPGPQDMGATPFLVGLGGGSGGKPKIREDLLFFLANPGIAREVSREESLGR